MWQSTCLVFLLNVVISSCYKPFVTREYYSKCCGNFEILKSDDNGTFFCDYAEEIMSNSYVLSNVSEIFPSKDCVIEQACVDVNEEGEFLKLNCDGSQEFIRSDVFPKCCPPNFSYNTILHSCDSVNDTIGFKDVLYIKSGLSHCVFDSAIEDFMVQQDDLLISNSGIFIKSKKVGFSVGNYCIDEDVNFERYVIRGCVNLSACKTSKKCVRKCCPDGESFLMGNICYEDNNYGINFTELQHFKESFADFAIIHGTECKKYIPNESVDFHIDENGNLHLQEMGSYLVYPPDKEMYCVEHTKFAKYDGDYFFLCAKTALPYRENKFIVSRTAMILSCVFLVLTIIAYIFIFEKVNLFGKTLVSFCFALLIAFIGFTYLQFHPRIDYYCVTYGYVLLYLSLTIFFWMNVICFDIWWTFGSPRSNLYPQQKRTELRRFLWYSLYGWGTPLVITIIAVIADFTEILPPSMRPAMGTTKCIIENVEGNYGKILYFIVPVSIVKVYDTFLFIRTIIHCLRVKNEINRMRDSQNDDVNRRRWFVADKEKLSLLLKLFIIMGVSWLFEVVSTIYQFGETKTFIYVEYVWDTINCLQGVFIFIIFVCKPKVFQTFRKKIGVPKGRRGSEISNLTQSSTLIAKNSVGKSIKMTKANRQSTNKGV